MSKAMSERRIELAKKLVRSMGAETNMTTTLNQRIQQVSDTEVKEIAKEKAEECKKSIIHNLAMVWASTDLTDEELEELIELVDSPIGKKLLAASVQTSHQSQFIANEMIRTFSDKLNQLVKVHQPIDPASFVPSLHKSIDLEAAYGIHPLFQRKSSVPVQLLQRQTTGSFQR